MFYIIFFIYEYIFLLFVSTGIKFHLRQIIFWFILFPLYLFYYIFGNLITF